MASFKQGFQWPSSEEKHFWSHWFGTHLSRSSPATRYHRLWKSIETNGKAFCKWKGFSFFKYMYKISYRNSSRNCYLQNKVSMQGRQSMWAKGAGGAKVPFLCCLLIEFLHFLRTLILLSGSTPFYPQAFITSHEMQQCFRPYICKVTLKLKFWRHYDVIINASALFQTSAPPALLLFRRPYFHINLL